ncbi:nuclear transport factor 2 family protein [Paractinoplanes ferrugineus]|nr:nuclear transport factor 2 family protein [Actinoplanes ferrugineus]
MDEAVYMWTVTISHREIFERYLYAGAITRNPDAFAELFTEDGIYEVPLAGDRLEGRAAIRAGIAVYQVQPEGLGTVNMELSKVVLHDTADPDVFIAEIDTVLDSPTADSPAADSPAADSPAAAEEEPAVARRTMSLVQIFRVRGEQIAHLRDYFETEPRAAAG